MIRIRSLIVFFLVFTLLIIPQVQADTRTNASDYYNKGNELVAQGNLQDALLAYTTAGSLDQQSLDQTYGLSYQKGWVLYRLGRYEESLAEFQNAERNHPTWITDFPIYYNEGCVLFKLGKYPEAVQKFDQALATDSTRREAWFNKGMALARSGRYNEAAEAFGKSRKASGSFLPLLGSYQEAANTYDQAQGIVHTEPAPEPAVTKAAAIPITPGVTFNPDLSTDLLMRQGMEYSAKYMYDDAIRAYSQVLANDPTNYRAMDAEAMALANVGRFDEALVLLDRAIPYVNRNTDEGTWTDLWYIRGWVQANLGNYDEALESFNNVISANPDAFPAYYNKAWVLSGKGDMNGAVAAYDQSLGWDNLQRIPVKSYSILGPVGSYKEAADAIDKTLTEKPIYISDFSTDPHWTTTNSRNYYWDSDKQVYHFTGDENTGVAGIPVTYKDTSLRLVYDISIIHADPGASVDFGIASHDTTYTTTDAIFSEFKSWTAGIFRDLKNGDKTYQVIAVSNGQKKTDEEKDYACFINREDDRRENTFGENRTYHVVIEYDKDKGTINTKVSDNLHEKTYFTCTGAYSNIGTIRNINQIILAATGSSNGNIEGYIDNVKLYAIGLPGVAASSPLWGTTNGGSGNVTPLGGGDQSTGLAALLSSLALPLVLIVAIIVGALVVYRVIVPPPPPPPDFSNYNVSGSTIADLKNRGNDLFISYSTKDAEVADAICHFLEADSVRCWMAPRNLRPGESWSEQVTNAIDDSKILVLVFSSNANNSRWVIRELERAVNKNLFIIPFRIENAPMSKSMELIVSTPHWLDALTHPREREIAILVKTVRGILKGLEGGDEEKPPEKNNPGSE